MSGSLKNFKIFVYDILIPKISYSHPNFDGNIRDLTCEIKDELCYSWLKSMHSWHDDILPPVITNKDLFIDLIYDDERELTFQEYRNDIYCYLELTLEEIVSELWAEHTGQYAEPFAGYERGE